MHFRARWVVYMFSTTNNLYMQNVEGTSRMFSRRGGECADVPYAPHTQAACFSLFLANILVPVQHAQPVRKFYQCESSGDSNTYFAAGHKVLTVQHMCCVQ